MDAETQVLRLAGRQFGVATRDQMLTRGMSTSQISRRLASGWLTVVQPRVYRVCGYDASFESRAMAAVLAQPPPAALSHRTSARVLGLRGARNFRGIEITVPSALRPRLNAVRVHRSGILDRHDVITTRDNLRIVRPERTLIGSASQVDGALLARMFDSAVLEGYTTTDRLWLYLTRYGGRGYPGSAALKQLLMRRDPRERPSQSNLESEWLEALALHGITGLVKQFEVMTSDGPKYIDLARPEFRTGLDFDSRLWHSSEEDYRVERRRRYVLAKAGWLLHPVTEFDLHERVDEIAADVRAWPETLACRSDPRTLDI